MLYVHFEAKLARFVAVESKVSRAVEKMKS